MITRDCRKSLSLALSSSQSFVDEAIVVDTGSTDGTPEVAKELGAYVIDCAWCDDFSAARNVSLDQATGDWIFWMDADDMLPVASGEAMRKAISDHPNHEAAFWMTVEDQHEDGNSGSRPTRFAQVRLFPRHPKIRFRYRVHEQVAPSIRSLGLPIRQLDAVVQHFGDRSPAAERARADRNLRLALLDQEERPEDPFVWLSVGEAYLWQPDGLPQAISHLRRAVMFLRPGSHTQLNAYYYLGQALTASSDANEAQKVYTQALNLYPNDSLLLTRLAAIHANAGRYNEAEKCYQTILERGHVRPQALHLQDAPAHAALQLGRLYARTGESQLAQRLWDDFLQHRPDATTIRNALAALRQ